MTVKLNVQCPNYSESNKYRIWILISGNLILILEYYTERCAWLSSDESKILLNYVS